MRSVWAAGREQGGQYPRTDSTGPGTLGNTDDPSAGVSTRLNTSDIHLKLLIYCLMSVTRLPATDT